MEPEKLLSRVVSAIQLGGNETFDSPPIFSCADQTHEPFRLLTQPFYNEDKDILFLWGIVRTVGAQFDGDRSDVHDVFSLIWAAVLRAFGLSSPWLLEEEHDFVPGEIGACHLILHQCPWNIEVNSFSRAIKSMNAWTAFIFHLLDDVFRWDRICNSSRPDLATYVDLKDPVWCSKVSCFLGNPDDTAILRRTSPLWIYFTSRKKGITVVRLPVSRITHLKRILTPFSPDVAKGEKALVIFANGIPNAVPYNLINRAKKILSLTGEAPDDALILPLDSHCLFIGNRTIVTIKGDCGRDIYNGERDRFIKRRRNEDRVFFSEAIIEWLTPLSADDFEHLCLDLIHREPGVIRAKPVGNTNDRDGGRDILIDWRIPRPHVNAPKTHNETNEETLAGGVQAVRIIAQIKTRSKTIGKRDVQDIRDTLDHYQADGFLLIAHPRISTALVDHLEMLRKKTGLLTEWLEIHNIEDRLRRHPDIARRYPKLLKLHSASPT